MKIEILFPEFCNLFGDMSNMRYLQKCLPEAEFAETAFEDEPLFLTETPGLIYLGPMTERTQEKVIEKLRPHKERLKSLIEGGTVFFFTGNAMETLGSYIETEKREKLPGLGLLPLHAKRDMMHRHNSVFLGTFRNEEIMGFKSQFTMAFPEDGAEGLFHRVKGIGLHQKCDFEGIRQNNFFGTYLLGPLLLLNPDFTRYLLLCMGVKEPALAFAEEAQAAYEARLQDFHAKI